MPANKSALMRYIIIDRMIRNRFKQYPSKEDLRSACEEALYGSGSGRISPSTIDKDLATMKLSPIEAPIKFDKMNGGYVYTDSNYSFSLPLDHEDIEALRLAANMLEMFKDADIFKNLKGSIEKISNLLNLNANIEDDKLINYVQFEKVYYYKGYDLLSFIFDCICKKLSIKFSYQLFSTDEIKEHIVDPFLIKEYQNRWYIIGFDNKAKKILTFGLDRIVELSTTGNRFKDLRGFNAKNYFEACFGITYYDTAPQKVVLSFSPYQGKYIKTMPLHSSQEVIKDNSKELSIALKIHITPEFIQTILGYGDAVRVVSPDSFKKQIIFELEKTRKLYK